MPDTEITTPEPEAPECKKLSAVRDESHKIGEFIDWLHEQGIQLCEWMDYEDAPAQYAPTTQTSEKLLAKYFDIDLNKVERERRAILEYLGTQNQ